MVKNLAIMVFLPFFLIFYIPIMVSLLILRSLWRTHCYQEGGPHHTSRPDFPRYHPTTQTLTTPEMILLVLCLVSLWAIVR